MKSTIRSLRALCKSPRGLVATSIVVAILYGSFHFHAGEVDISFLAS
jgi:hypothetical protein